MKCLENGMGIAPKLIYTVDGKRYIRADGFYYYMMEYIDGRQLEETPQDEYDLGRLAYLLHSLREKDASVPLLLSALDSDKERFYAWFLDKAFKPEFDAILDELPDFCDLDQCFIHSDLGPHNAMRRKSGEVVLVDLDDSGIGSRHLDLGWAFIMQFVDFCHATGRLLCTFPICSATARMPWIPSLGYCSLGGNKRKCFGENGRESFQNKRIRGKSCTSTTRNHLRI